MTTQTSTDGKILDFNYKYASLFFLSSANDYSQVLQGIYGEEGDRYTQNKCRDVEITCEKAYKSIVRDLNKDRSPEEQAISHQAIEDHKTLIYEFFGLSPEEQHRVRGLIKKIKAK